MKKENYDEQYLDELELLYTPHTKALLIEYVSCQYEEYADYSDESLKRELNLLYQEGQLIRLFTGEYILSAARLIKDSRK
jgi:hypothetical protein